MSLSPHVAILRWPDDAAAVAFLRAEGRPRLLLVAPDATAPASTGLDEDWIRMPASEDDVRARAEALEARSVPGADRPTLRRDGRLFFGGAWVALSPIEEDIARTLAEHFGEVVDPRMIVASTGRSLSPTAVRVHLTRLRKRLGTIGLVIHTVRSRGYVLDVASPERHSRDVPT
jgi:two-component system, OmpR family, response regulator